MARMLSTVAALIVVGPLTVYGHGFMNSPMPEFADIYNKNAPSATTPGYPGPYKGNDEIRGLAERAGSHCGKTNPNTIRAVPSANSISFTITAQHIGPCEIWLDDTRVVSARECWTQYPNHVIPVDFSKCRAGGCKLRWVWMATHTTPWEFYDNCVQLDGSGNVTPQPSAPITTKPTPSVTPQPTSPITPKPSNPGQCYQGKGGDPALTAWCQANCAAGYCPDTHCEPCK